MLSFGTIFRHKETYYVYLIQIDDIIYAARILDKNITVELRKNLDIKSRNPSNRTHEKQLYSFVVLSTKGFEDQAAHYGSPDMPTDISIEPMGILNKQDLKSLKDEISKDAAISQILRQTLLNLEKH